MRIFKSVLFFALILAGFNEKVLAQDVYIIKTYDVIISGTSNLHNWTARVVDLTGKAHYNSSTLSNVSIIAQARTIESSKGKIMDSKMRNALRVDKHPVIFYKSVALKAKSENKCATQITADGSITISGVTKPITTTTNCKFMHDGSVEVVGSFDVLMTDFGIEPPTALFGTLITGNKVSITYKIVFEKIS